MHAVLVGTGGFVGAIIGENDRRQNRLLDEWIVRRAREYGLAGATVIRGRGSARRACCTRRRSSACRPIFPVVSEIVDTKEKIDEAVWEGLATVEPVDIRFYRSSETE